jgi:hypothetical protein
MEIIIRNGVNLTWFFELTADDTDQGDPSTFSANEHLESFTRRLFSLAEISSLETGKGAGDALFRLFGRLMVLDARKEPSGVSCGLLPQTQADRQAGRRTT